MKKILLLVPCFMTTLFSMGQNADRFYKKGDSLYKIKDFKGSAIAYADGIRMEGKTASVNRYRSSAAGWALAGEADSAFHYLDMIALSPKVNKVHARNIQYGEEFIPLYKDKRWPLIVDKFNMQSAINGYPQEELIYGRKDGMGLTLIYIKPKVKANGKAILSVVSGSWVSSYNGIEMHTEAAEQYLVKGYTVFAVMHGSQPRYTIQDALNDIKRAVRYVRYNAGLFGIDPNHIGITGSSAGGHLSLLVATADEKINATANDPVDRVSSRVQAVAVLFPPTDLLNYGGPGLNFVNAKELLKPSRVWGAVDFKTRNERFNIYEEVTDTAVRNKIGKEISPIYAVSADDPPAFIMHGDADPTVPLQQSRSIIARFNVAGVPNRYIIKKGGKHNGDDMKPEWMEFVDWFDKYLK